MCSNLSAVVKRDRVFRRMMCTAQLDSAHTSAAALLVLSVMRCYATEGAAQGAAATAADAAAAGHEALLPMVWQQLPGGRMVSVPLQNAVRASLPNVTLCRAAAAYVATAPE